MRFVHGKAFSFLNVWFIKVISNNSFAYLEIVRRHLKILRIFIQKSQVYVHNVTVVHFQPRGVVILTCSRQALRGTQAPIFICRPSLWLCRTLGEVVFTHQTQLVWNQAHPTRPHTSFMRACMFNHLQLNLTCLHTRPSPLARPCL